MGNLAISLEVLQQMGLTKEQIEFAKIAAMEQQNNGEAEQHDSMSQHLDKILSLPANVSKWSTDPVHRLSFMMPSTSKGSSSFFRRGSFSKSAECLSNKSSKPPPTSSNSTVLSSKYFESVDTGKENKRSCETSFLSGVGSFLKKARSSDMLSKASQSELDEYDAYMPDQLEDEEINKSVPQTPVTPAKPELYSWNGMVAAESPKVNKAEDKKQNLPASPKLVAKTAEKNLRLIEQSTSALPNVPSFHELAASVVKTEEVNESEKLETPSEPRSPLKTGYSLHDLLLEFTTTELNNLAPCSATDDKYGSLYELQTSSPTSEDSKQTFANDSGIQSEPIIRNYPAPLSACTELSAQPFLEEEQEGSGQHDLLGVESSNIKPSFSGVLQSRFVSKHGIQFECSNESIATIAESTGSIVDELLSVFESTDNLPLMSPSYSAMLRDSQVPIALKSSEKPEITSLSDPMTSRLLSGVREEISSRDHALYLNYKNCMRHQHSSLPLSFPEMKHLIEEYGLEIQFKEEKRTADVKQIFLLPLNSMTVPRWVPPGTTFRVGRGSNWFLGQTRVVSRNHCEIFHDIHSYYVRDVGSRSGTFVNGTRLGEAGALSPTRELRHGDILQIGVDYASERDAYGHVDNRFKSGQCMVLYGYKAKSLFSTSEESKSKSGKVADEPKKRESKKEIQAPSVLTMCDSKFERMCRKAMSGKSRVASANAKIHIELGDFISATSSGTAIFYRPNGHEPSYSFCFNNYRLSWDLSMTCRQTGRRLGMSIAGTRPDNHKEGVIYNIWNEDNREKIIAKVTIIDGHKVTLEPVYAPTMLEQEEIFAEKDLHQPIPSYYQAASSTSSSPFIIADGSVHANRPQNPFSVSSMSSIQAISTKSLSHCSSPSTIEAPTPRNPFYTINGDLTASSTNLFIQRFANSRKQVFLGEGQVVDERKRWGRKIVSYEGRLPPSEQHDDMIALTTVFNVLNQTQQL